MFSLFFPIYFLGVLLEHIAALSFFEYERINDKAATVLKELETGLNYIFFWVFSFSSRGAGYLFRILSWFFSKKPLPAVFLFKILHLTCSFLQRMEKFGITAGATAATSVVASSEVSAKIAERAQRFAT